MPDMATMIYHANLQQIRRVLTAMGPERIEKGLTAFEDGGSNWEECFFARAFDGELGGYDAFDLTKNRRGKVETYHHPAECHVPLHMSGNPSHWISHALKLETSVPVKIVWQTFDGMNEGGALSKDDLYKFISAVLDESRPQEVLDIIKTTKYDLEKEITFSCRS